MIFLLLKLKIYNKKYYKEKDFDNLTQLINEFNEYIQEEYSKELNNVIKEFNLNKEETFKFMNNSFGQGELKIFGTAINNILPPLSRFSKKQNRTKIKNDVINNLEVIFDRYFNI